MSPAAAQAPPQETFHITDVYQPWPKQIAFHASNAKYRLEVGGYGSGKSLPLLWEAIFHALEYPGSESIILRKTIPDLKRTVISKFLSEIPKEIYDYYHETDKIVYFHRDKVTGRQSKLYLAACETEKDVGKYLSTEFVFIGFEELGEFSFAVWDALIGRCRCPIPGSRSCVAGATNPMGIGWPWIKKLWVDKVPAYGMSPELYNPNDYEYFHSTVDDNPIYNKDPEYLRTLESSPLRDRIRWGKLDAVSGQYFDNWEQNRHVRPKTDFLFQPWQTMTVGWDYGFGHYATILWLTKAILKPRWEGEQPKSVNVFTRELALHENTPKQQAEALVMNIPRLHDANGIETGYAETVDSVHFSWERFNRTVSNFTVADEVGDLLSAAGLPRPSRSNTDRVAGWIKMYTLLDTDELFVLNNCPMLAEAIPLLVRDDVNLEDVKKPPGLSLNDDIADGARYAIAGALLDPDSKPAEEKFRERLAGIKDPFRRHMEQFKEYQLQNARQRKGPKQVIIPTWRNRIQ